MKQQPSADPMDWFDHQFWPFPVAVSFNHVMESKMGLTSQQIRMILILIDKSGIGWFLATETGKKMIVMDCLRKKWNETDLQKII